MVIIEGRRYGDFLDIFTRNWISFLAQEEYRSKDIILTLGIIRALQQAMCFVFCKKYQLIISDKNDIFDVKLIILTLKYINQFHCNVCSRSMLCKRFKWICFVRILRKTFHSQFLLIMKVIVTANLSQKMRRGLKKKEEILSAWVAFWSKTDHSDIEMKSTIQVAPSSSPFIY